MFQIFSTEFLNNLRAESSCKVKTSKAILDAIKDLTALNESNKKQIAILKSEISQLKQENQMLMELLDTTKSQFKSALLGKETKLNAAFEIQAKLTSENEALLRKIQNIQLELYAYKQMTQRLKENTEIGSKQDLRLSGFTNSKHTIKGSQSQFDLQAYLTNEQKKLRTSRSKTVKSICESQQNTKKNSEKSLKKQNMEISFFQDADQQQKQKSLASKSAHRKSRSEVEYTQLNQSIFSGILQGQIINN